MNKLKTIFKNWLFSKEINDIDQCISKIDELNLKINNSLSQLIDSKRTCDAATRLLDDSRDALMSIINVGVDVHVRNHLPHSWAVICIKEKPKYIQFVDLSNKDVRQIIEYLKRFKGSNIITDSPFRMETI